MAGKNKNIKTGFPGFMKYRENNLSGREKNAFEKELQKDPFAEEAEEGLSAMDTDSLKKDMNRLSDRLKRRTTRNRKIIYYRIAASVALLIGISTIYLFLTRSQEKANKPNIEPAPIVLYRPEPIISKSEGASEAGKGAVTVRKKIINPQMNQAVSETKIAENLSSKEKPDSAIHEFKIADITMPAPPLARSISFKSTKHEIKGKVVSTDDKMPLPGVNVTIKGTSIGTVTDMDGNYRLQIPAEPDLSLVASCIGMDQKEIPLTGDSVVNLSLNPSVAALSEVVVVGYGEKKSADRNITGAVSKVEFNKDQAIINYTNPEPVSGKENFEKYIQDNIHKPDILKDGQKAVVVLSFTVRFNGSPDSIRVIRSPGQEYSREAIRLIKEGPKWKPATENGNTIEEEARVRIVFK